MNACMLRPSNDEAIRCKRQVAHLANRVIRSTVSASFQLMLRDGVFIQVVVAFHVQAEPTGVMEHLLAGLLLSTDQTCSQRNSSKRTLLLEQWKLRF